MNKLNFEILSQYNGLERKKGIQFSLSEKSKEKFKTKATELNVSMAEYIRAAVHSDDIFVQHDPEGNAARMIIEANDALSCSLKDKNLNTDIVNSVVYKLNEIFMVLNGISEILPNSIVNSTPDVVSDNTTEQSSTAYDQPKSGYFQFKDCEKLNEFIEQRAEKLELTKSQFLRTAVLADNKVHLLRHGKYLSRYIIEFQKNLNIAFQEGKIEEKYEKILRSKSDDVFNKFIEVSLMLTNINEIEGSINEEVEA